MAYYEPTYFSPDVEDTVDTDFAFLTPLDVQRELSIGKNTFYASSAPGNCPPFVLENYGGQDGRTY